MGSIYEALTGKPGPQEGDQPKEGPQGQGDSSFGLANMAKEVKAGQGEQGEVKNEEVAGVLGQHDKQMGTLQQERAESTNQATSGFWGDVNGTIGKIQSVEDVYHKGVDTLNRQTAERLGVDIDSVASQTEGERTNYQNAQQRYVTAWGEYLQQKDQMAAASFQGYSRTADFSGVKSALETRAEAEAALRASEGAAFARLATGDTTSAIQEAKGQPAEQPTGTGDAEATRQFASRQYGDAWGTEPEQPDTDRDNPIARALRGEL